MAYLIEWQIKAAIMVALMVIVFALFLSKDAMFNRNRVWLLSTLFVPWIIPFIAMPVSVKSILFAPEAELDLTTLSIPVTTQTNITEQTASVINWSNILLAFYLLISMVFVVRLLWGYTYLFKLKGKSKKLKTKGFDLYLLEDNDINPFSFFQSVFVPQSVLEQADRDHILNHERAHCRQWHSVDITLAEWMLILQWWNPFAWWLRKLIAQNHEFCVDKAMMQISEEPKQYQYSLMNYLPGSKSLKLVNNFSQSLIKKRIIMMNNKTDRKLISKMKSLLVMIMTFTALVAFTNPDKTEKQTKKKEVVENIKTSDDLRKFVAQNLKYPIEARNNNFTGDVTVNVPINKSGKAGKPEIGEAKGSDVVNPGEVVVVAYAPEDGASGYDSSVSLTGLENEVKRVMTKLPTVEDVNLLGKTLELKVKFVLQKKDEQVDVTKPAIYLDGKRFYGDMKTIAPSQIASVNVLRDEDAVAKYGEDHRIGVIEVTTKSDESKEREELVVVGSGKMDDNPVKVAAEKSGSNPLYVLNGEEISKKEFDAIKKDKIESVSVLKDESAIAEYGDKGKNGVIIISLSK
ncbi:M56 family metallopeptidase [Carboxylicivirga caseinilyticus]|uniref:M56 family metallopeptidase n=1 Tax=Carboxylicivirga caseinilyticus TaxID=3417572 RepID=UPI003D34D319|nr:hypothetical protein [Marinilabiliaceae bacterium A049]